MQNRARTQATERDRHAATGIAIEQRLRAVRLATIDQRLLGSTWQAKPLRLARETLPDLQHLFGANIARKLDAGALKMALAGGDAIAVRADHDGRVGEAGGLAPIAQHFLD